MGPGGSNSAALLHRSSALLLHRFEHLPKTSQPRLQVLNDLLRWSLGFRQVVQVGEAPILQPEDIQARLVPYHKFLIAEAAPVPLASPSVGSPSVTLHCLIRPRLHRIPRPLLGQPLLAGLVLRQGSLDALPEGGAVVRLMEMDELVHDEVVDDGRR
jgi:hypothetical protein